MEKGRSFQKYRPTIGGGGGGGLYNVFLLLLFPQSREF